MRKRRYTPQQKVEALSAIRQHHGDLPRVSEMLNIPVRTLNDWRKALEAGEFEELFAPPPPPPPPNSPDSVVPPLHESAFGMTHDELLRALQVEYLPSPYEDLRQALMMHITRVQVSISDDPDMAHVRALAVSRMIDDVLRLEPLCRLEKPQLNIIKYEYKDGTYHDIPEWNNVVYERAEQAYNAVLLQARREYHAFKGEVYDESPSPSAMAYGIDPSQQPTLEELAQMHFTPEDFVPTPRGYFAWMKTGKFEPKTDNPNTADYSFFDEGDNDED